MKPDDRAVIMIRNAAEMTSYERRKIAEWLRRQAAALLKDGPEYAQRFTARYKK